MSTAAVLSPSPVQKFFDNNSNPLAGGKVYTYAGGTSTPIATYTDNTASIPNANPITLNARGEAAIWLLPNVAYKYVVQDSVGNVISTTDQITVSQLLTLYAGVDTGTASNYVLNFVASFSSLTNGIVLYWIPANSSTAIGSTLNVNGFGAIPILNLNGSAIGANQIVANQITQTVYYAGNWYLNTIGAYVGPLIGTFGTETAIASAGTIDLGTATAHVVAVSGTTTITSFGSSASVVAPIYVVRFTGILTLTNGANLLLPGQENIVTNAGDALLAEYQGSGKWQVLLYQTNEALAANAVVTLTGFTTVVSGAIYYILAGSPAGYVCTLFANGSTWTATSNATSMTMTGLPAALTPANSVTVTTLVENSGATYTPAIATIDNTGVITFQVLEVSGTTLVPIGFVNSGTKGLGVDWAITYPL